MGSIPNGYSGFFFSPPGLIITNTIDEIKDLRWEMPSPQQQSLSGIATSTAAQPLPFPATCTTDKRTNFGK